MLTSRAHAPGVESPNSATLFRWWVATFVVVNLFVVLLTSFWLTQSRDQNIHMAGVTATNLSKVLERYVLGTVDKIDLGLLAVADEFARQSGRGGIDEKTLEDALARQLSHLPEIESLRIADSRGTVRYGRGVVPGVSIDDRGYFIAARDNPAAGLIISQPVFARITQKWVVVLARRLERADGSFGGVVYANLGIEQLINAFATLDVGPRGSVTLRDGELGVIARYPEPRGPGSTIGNKNVSPEFRSLVQTGNTEGSFAVVSSLDKVERLFSFRRIGRHPLYIIVGLARDDVLAGWHGEVASAAALLAIFIAATTIAGWVFFRVWKRLIESRQQVRAIVETEPECVKVLSLDGTLRDMNRAGLDMIEAESLDQVAGRSVLDIVAPPYRAAFAALGEKVARGEPGELEFEIVGLKGGRRWLETRAVPLRDEWGKITGLLGVTRDVTDKKRTAEALRHGEERLREAQRIAQLGSWELDLATRELTWSEEIYRIFEIDPRKFGASYEAFIAAVHPDDRERVQHAYEISVKNRLPYEITHRLQMPDGTVKYVRERCETSYDAEGKPLRSTGTVQDVTLAVLNEEALRES